MSNGMPKSDQLCESGILDKIVLKPIDIMDKIVFKQNNKNQ